MERYKVVKYSQWWYGILNTETDIMLRVGPNPDYTKPLDDRENKLLLFKSKDKAQEYIDSNLLEEKLIQSSSNKALQQNIKTEIDSGKSPKQAAAIAYSIQRKNESMKLKEGISKNVKAFVEAANKAVEWYKTFMGDASKIYGPGSIIGRKTNSDYYTINDPYIAEVLLGFTEDYMPAVDNLKQEMIDFGFLTEDSSKEWVSTINNLSMLLSKLTNDEKDKLWMQFPKYFDSARNFEDWDYEYLPLNAKEQSDRNNNDGDDLTQDTEDIDWDKVQWGVHQFSTNSIIFRGTKKECQLYIDDRPELWDDAEVYFMLPDDPHYMKDQNDQELEEAMGDKIYAVIVKYHNEPKERLEARSAKDNEDLEYQLNMDDEVEWYDFDEKQFNESLEEVKTKIDKENLLTNFSSIKSQIQDLVSDYKNQCVLDDETYDDYFADDDSDLFWEYSNQIKDILETFLSKYYSGNDLRDFIDEFDFFDPYNKFDLRNLVKDLEWFADYEDLEEDVSVDTHDQLDKEDIKPVEEIEPNKKKSVEESLDQMREKALKMKENSNAFAILYGYRVKGKEVELEPEEFATEEEYKDRINQITNSFTKLSDKDPRGNRYGKESGIEFYAVYPNKKSNINESIVDAIDLKWNIGSDKSNLTPEELDLLERLAQKLEVNSPNGYKYVTQSTYEDYGSGMRWWNIVCYNKKGHSWQVLNTKEWLDLMNTGDVDKVYQDVINEDYFQDKPKNISDMNMGELFNHSWDDDE